MAGSLVFGGEDWDVQEKVQDATLTPSVLDKAYAACILVTLPTVQHLPPDTEVMVQCTILSFVILDTEMRSALGKLKPGSVDFENFYPAFSFGVWPLCQTLNATVQSRL